MSEPERLLDGTVDDFEAALLRSAKRDGPSRRATQRVLVAIGLGTSALAAGAAVATASAANASVPPAAAAAAGAGLGTTVLLKWIGLAAVGGLVAWGVVHETRSQVTTPASLGVAPVVAEVAAHQPTIAPPAAEETPPAAEPAPVAAAEETTEEPVARAEKPATRREKHADAANAANLDDEISALDKARRAMDDDPEAALAAVEEYEKKFQGGALADQAEVVRIESLARAGKVDEARAAGATFLAKHPSSPAAKRVRSILAKL
jgi:hypothetical protein